MLRRELEGKQQPSTAVIMEMLSERYGWTPNQIRQQPLEDILAYFDVIAAKNKLLSKKHGPK